MKDNDIYGIDKLYHMTVCCILSFFCTEAAIVASIYKEYKDNKTEGNHWCWWDLIADVFGIIEGTGLRLLTIGSWYLF